MNAWIILAEAASAHPDGTVSMLRVGINRVKTDTVPVLFRGSLVARIEAEPSERGSHDFAIDCFDEDGREKLQRISGTIQIPPIGGQSNIIIGINSNLPTFGSYAFSLTVDKTERARMLLKVEKIEAPNVNA